MKKTKSNRTLRFEDQIQHEIMDIIVSQIDDVRLKWINVVKVELNNDRSLAKIYYTDINFVVSKTINAREDILHDELDTNGDLSSGYIEEKKNAEIVHKVLENSNALIRSLLAKKLHTFTVPQLRFIYDNSLMYMAKMDEIFIKDLEQ